jgi:plastocyanin
MKAIKNIIRFSVLSLGAVLCGHSLSTSGATTNVTAGDFFFSPKIVTVNVGDTVVWANLPSDGHTSTSAPTSTESEGELWNGSSDNFSVTFTSAEVGTNNYFCIPHQSLGMIGSVIVKAAPSVPPVVSITSPVAGAVFSAPASVAVQASASVSSGTVTNVQFLVGSTILTNRAAAPFAALTGSLAAGAYNLSAIASSSAGLKATNSVTINVIAPTPVVMGTPAFSSPGNFQFSYSANIGLTYVVQVSTNLSNWNSLATNTATANPVIFTTAESNGSGAFYRVELMPNP